MEWNGKMQILGVDDLTLGIWKHKPPDFETITLLDTCKVEATDLIPIFPPNYLKALQARGLLSHSTPEGEASLASLHQ